MSLQGWMEFWCNLKTEIYTCAILCFCSQILRLRLQFIVSAYAEWSHRMGSHTSRMTLAPGTKETFSHHAFALSTSCDSARFKIRQVRNLCVEQSKTHLTHSTMNKRPSSWAFSEKHRQDFVHRALQDLGQMQNKSKLRHVPWESTMQEGYPLGKTQHH